MKCANCGKEFGSGTHCQNCGIDRVAGLANYSGYDSHAGSNGYDSSSYGGQTSPKTTVCYACNEIIPIGATYCPVCGKKLLVTCPMCGHEYSSQYPVCSKCGTNRVQYIKRLRAEEEAAKRVEEEKRRKQREWEQAENARKKEEQKKQEEEKNVDIIIFFIFSPIWGIFWYAGVNEMLPKWGVQIPEFWPKTLSAEIIVCLILGMLTHYIYWIIDRNK
jgi:predicted RNA-binding Zn-ribbon protein involved in translation (DUF1610 family)